MTDSSDPQALDELTRQIQELRRQIQELRTAMEPVALYGLLEDLVIESIDTRVGNLGDYIRSEGGEFNE